MTYLLRTGEKLFLGLYCALKYCGEDMRCSKDLWVFKGEVGERALMIMYYGAVNGATDGRKVVLAPWSKINSPC
jgi:hypothetical protein